MMIRLMIAAVAVATAATGASANNSVVVVQSAPTAHVSFADLDLNSSTGRGRLAGRIHLAANSLCTENNVEPLAVRLGQINCYQVAMASGLEQMAAITGQ